MLRGWLVPVLLFFMAALVTAPIWPYNNDGLAHITAWAVPIAFMLVVVGIFAVAILENR